MDETEIKKLLAVQPRESVQRSWHCPNESQLAEYVKQGFSDAARNSIEKHITHCDFCLSQVAFLTQAEDWADASEAPAQLVSKARQLVSQKPKSILNWDWRWAASAAAVAGFALLFVIVALQWRKSQSESVAGPLIAQQTTPEPPALTQPRVTPPVSRTEPTAPLPTAKAKSMPPPTVRSKAGAQLLPKLTTPRDGAVLRRSDLDFQWEPVSDAIFYEVRVMSTEGNLMFEGQTEETRLKPGPTAPLVPGTKYFVVIRAHLRQGRTANSSVVSFQLAGR
jgi:hypothetical protein